MIKNIFLEYQKKLLLKLDIIRESEGNIDREYQKDYICLSVLIGTWDQDDLHLISEKFAENIKMISRNLAEADNIKNLMIKEVSN